jgi:Ca2+-binding EF-hand superfamily protein
MTMTKMTLLALALAGVTGAAGVALAQDTTTETTPEATETAPAVVAEADTARPLLGPAFATLDADGDGLLTAEELTAQAQARFAAADANSDGGLSVEEIVAMMEAERLARATERLTQADANGDGLLQVAELADRMPDLAQMLERADLDEDGAVSAEEYGAFQARLADRMGGDHDGPRGDGGQHGEGHGDGHGDGEGRRSGGFFGWFNN